MIARMPEVSRPSPSPPPKPSRLSISFWLRTRAVPTSPPSAGLSSDIAAHSAASLSSSTAGSAILPPTPSSLVRARRRSLHQHLLEEDIGDLGGRDRGVDAAQQLLAQPVKAGRALQI